MAIQQTYLGAIQIPGMRSPLQTPDEKNLLSVSLIANLHVANCSLYSGSWILNTITAQACW